jgi:hypothetical protein
LGHVSVCRAEMLVICIASGTLYNESMACTIIHLSLSVRPFSDEVSSAVFVCLIASFVVTPSPAPLYLCALRHLIPFAVGGNDGKEDSEYRARPRNLTKDSVSPSNLTRGKPISSHGFARKKTLCRVIVGPYVIRVCFPVSSITLCSRYGAYGRSVTVTSHIFTAAG